jgi:hypothetical protein
MWTNPIKHAASAFQNPWRQSVPTPLPIKEPATGLTRVVEDATAALGKHLQALGRNLGENQASLGLGSVASFTAAKGLEKTGKYLETEGFHGVVGDVGSQVKKNPIPFVLAGIGLGFLAGRLLPSRNTK